MTKQESTRLNNIDIMREIISGLKTHNERSRKQLFKLLSCQIMDNLDENHILINTVRFYESNYVNMIFINIKELILKLLLLIR